MYHQLVANTICQNRHALKFGGKHRDPRCSLDCRANWAAQEAAVLIYQLRQIVHTHNVYFGNIQIESDLTLAEHLLVRKRFLKLLRAWKRSHNFDVEFRAAGEIGNNGRIHYHYCVYSSRHISHAAMRQIWEHACSPVPVILCHDPPKKGIEAAAKYMFKDLKRVRERKKWIWLFAYDTIRITWNTRGFFSPNRTAVQAAVKQSWKQSTP